MNTRVKQALIGILQKIQLFLKPKTIQGKDALLQVSNILIEKQISHVFIMTTEGTVKRGSINHLLTSLKENNIRYNIFSKIQPDPDTDCVDNACLDYRNHSCEAIVAIGGGSVMDCAKLVAAFSMNPKIKSTDMIRSFHIKGTLPPLIAVPTTSGSGSEVSAGAVITNLNDKRKYPLADLRMIPKYAILDPCLLTSLPSKMTAFSGMDALTHAIEAYINHFNIPATSDYAMHAIKLIFQNLPTVYKNGNDIDARNFMLTAAYEAGIAMTNNYVGYVHALAHGIGGKYHLPHGYLNAILLPLVLEEYGKAITTKLAILAKEIGLQGSDNHTLAKQFIQSIHQLNETFAIPSFIQELQESDIEQLAKFAMEEGIPTYPTPVIWDIENFKNVLHRASINDMEVI